MSTDDVPYLKLDTKGEHFLDTISAISSYAERDVVSTAIQPKEIRYGLKRPIILVTRSSCRGLVRNSIVARFGVLWYRPISSCSADFQTFKLLIFKFIFFLNTGLYKEKKTNKKRKFEKMKAQFFQQFFKI